MQIALYPTQEQIQALLADPDQTPVVMLNLLRFKPGAEAAYRRYADAMRKVVVEIATSKEVAAIGVQRAEGLAGQWLLATRAESIA